MKIFTFSLIPLIFLTCGSVYAEDAQSKLAGRIETLAYSHPPTPTLEDDPNAWGEFTGATLRVSQCILGMEMTSYSAFNDPFVSMRAKIDLSTATLVVGADASPILHEERSNFFGNSETNSARGALSFEAHTDTFFTMEQRQPTPEMTQNMALPETWPFVPTQQPFLFYVLNIDVTEQRMRDLGGAVLQYQQTYCSPLS